MNNPGPARVRRTPEPAPASSQRPRDLNSPEALHAATERLHALGIDEEIVFSSDNAADTTAYFASLKPSCASGT
jgi:hypothetical protein